MTEATRPRLLVLALGTTLILGWGTGYFLPGALGPAMEPALGLPAGGSFIGLTLQLGMAGLLAPWMGRMIDRHGPRRIMATGSVIYAAGLGLLAAAQGPLTALGACLVMGLAASMTLSEASNAALATLGAKGARRRIGIVTAVSGLASGIAWPVLAALDDAVGWRGAVLAAAAAHLLVALPLHLATLPTSTGAPRAPRGKAPPLPVKLRWLSAAMTMQVLVGSALLSNMVGVVESLGLDRGSAIFWASLTGPAQVAARLFDAAGGARASAVTMASLALLAMPLSILVPVVLPQGVGFAVPVFVLAYGLASGVMSVMRPACLIELHGTEGYATVAGRVMGPVTTGMALSPSLFAPLLLWAGPDVALPVIAGLAFIGFLMLRIAARRA